MMYVNFAALILGAGFWLQTGELGIGVLMWLILLGIGTFVFSCFVYPVLTLLAVVLGLSFPWGTRDGSDGEC